MIPSKNIVIILFLIIYLGGILPNYAIISECINKIYFDFDFGDKRPKNYPKEVLPMKAFLKKTINEFNTEEGKSYFKHLHDELYPKESMLLPRNYCSSQTEGQAEYTRCINQLHSKFLTVDDKSKVLKDAFWNLKETDFITKDPIREMDMIKINRNGTTKIDEFIFVNLDCTINYRFMYFFYLSQCFQYHQIEREYPFTPREFCNTRQRLKANKINNKLFNEDGKTSISPKKEVIRVNRTKDLI